MNLGLVMQLSWPDAYLSGWVIGGLLLLVALRLLQNLLPGKAPPVFEGLPFIGGILKFSKVELTAILTGNSSHVVPSACPSRLFEACDVRHECAGSTQSHR